MSGSAILGTNLVDSLVPMADNLRRSLHPQFGVRPYRMHAVKRSWSGDDIGDGAFTDVETEIEPQPRIGQWDGLKHEVDRCGLDTMGDIMATEVSLTYTEAELTGGNLANFEELLIKVSEAHGQGTTTRYYSHAKPPYVDREDGMGWVLWLKLIKDQ